MKPSQASQPTEVWAAIHTPFTASLALDEEGLRRNVRRYVSLGLKGVFCNGLMGEVWSLTHDERKHVVDVMTDEAQGHLGISVVISASSIEETLALGEHAKRANVAHVVLMVPTAGPRSDEQQLAYFRLICARLDVPVVIFNAANAAGSALAPATFAKLCDLPQLTLLKTTAYAENLALRQAARNAVVVSDPLEEHFLRNRVEHAQPILYADPEPYLYQVPGHRPVAEYIAQLDRGSVAHAEAAAASLAPMRSVFNKWIMEPLNRGHMPNAALKHWCDVIGLVGGAVRPPIRPLSGQEKHELEADLVACGAPGLALPARA